jgi:hypothetical protein
VAQSEWNSPPHHHILPVFSFRFQTATLKRDEPFLSPRHHKKAKASGFRADK